MPSRDLSLTCSILRYHIPKLIAEFDAIDSARHAKVVYTLRDLREQQALYAVGRTLAPIGPGNFVTTLDGVNHKSRHQAQERHGEVAAHAVDLGVFTRAGYDGTHVEFYEPLIAIAETHGLRSGLDWDCDGKKDAGWTDGPHLECRVEPGVPHTVTA